VEISNIHCKKIPVKSVSKGQYCSIWIKSAEKIKREDLRKGMVLLDMQIKPVATKTFEADIWTIDGTRKTLKSKYQPVLYIKHIRQGCRILEFKHKHGNNRKNSSSNNLISYANSNKIKKIIINNNNNPNALNAGINVNDKKNNYEMNSNSINHFVAGYISNFNCSLNNSSEIKIANIHPLLNLPNRSELKGSFDATFNCQKKDLDYKINNNLNKTEAEPEQKTEAEPGPEEEVKGIEKSNTIIDNKEAKVNVVIKTNTNTNNKDQKKKNSLPNSSKKSDYNSDNAISNANYKENVKAANKAGKHKKSSISKTEELDIKVKSDFNSDKNIIRLNELSSEYENLKQKENEDNEETCVISPHNNCTVVFEFMYNPEYITEDANILISDQLIKAHGIVRKLLV